MTFDQVVNKIKERLNLTAVDATNRVGEFVNDRYRQVTSAIGLEAVRLQTTSLVVHDTDPGLPEITAANYDKIDRIMLANTAVTPNTFRPLKELTYDELTAAVTKNGEPRAWAVKNFGAHSVTYVVDAIPASGKTYTLNLNGYTRQTDISGTTEPVFPEDFHDVLIHGGMSDELRKMEKPDLAEIAEGRFEQRLSDLRMFIAKSAYMDIVQGKNKASTPWGRSWPNLVS